MARNVPKGAKVNILSQSPRDEYIWLLERMLKSVATVTVADRTDSSSTEVLAMIGKYQESMIDTMVYAKTIVCLKFAIPGTAQKHLTGCRDITIVEIDPQIVLKRNEVSQTLKKVVPWLKRNLSVKDMDRIQITSDNSVCLSKDVLCRLPFKLSLENQFGRKDVFVITGGITGLGWQTILMLVEKGVGTVGTVSRREVDDETKRRIEDTQLKYGCRIVCYRGDICDLQAVQAMIGDLTTTYGSERIRGIIHGAGVLDGQLLLNMEKSHLDKVMAPKVLGVLNLHMATEHLNLDIIITQSSISSIIGLPGQGNYGAANVFLDAFARWRRSRGLAAQSINWGSLEVGMAAQTRFLDNLVKRGYHFLSIAEIRGCLLHAIMQNSTEVVYASLDWSIIARDFTVPKMTRMAVSMKDVLRQNNVGHVSQQIQESEEEFRIDALKDTDNKTRKHCVEKYIETVARKSMGTDIDRLKTTTTFEELGMESLAAVTFSNVVYQDTGYRIAQGTLLEKSPEDVAAEVCSNAFGFASATRM